VPATLAIGDTIWHVTSSRTAFETIAGRSLYKLRYLTITHGKDRFTFTEQALVRQFYYYYFLF
jgi:hypothetical protein